MKANLFTRLHTFISCCQLIRARKIGHNVQLPIVAEEKRQIFEQLLQYLGLGDQIPERKFSGSATQDTNMSGEIQSLVILFLSLVVL